jgi:hypothetical protein
VRLRLLLAVLVCLWASSVDAANLCVKTGGNDGTAKASISYSAGNEAGSTCWATIGRAMWGNADRSTPSSSQAADAGDTVYVFGGTYQYSGNCSPSTGNCRLIPLYDPTNTGMMGSPITVTSVGTVVVAAQNWNGPAVGANTKNYIKWYADISLGYKFTMTAYSSNDDNAGANEVDVTPDTGPLVYVGCTGCEAEGFEINGGAENDWGDNYPGIRLEGCDSCVARNNYLYNFMSDATHSYGINTYDGDNILIEHNRIDSVDACIAPKDNGPDTTSIVFRFNYCTNARVALVWSISTITSMQVYQNVVSGLLSWPGASSFIHVTGADLNDTDIFNNVFYNGSGGTTCIWNGGYDTSRFWNNICHTAPRMISHDSGATGPTAADLDLEHNVLYNATTVFYTGGDGSKSFADWKTAYANQCEASPACVTTDPRFANPAGSDFRLCTAAGVPHASCVGASPAIGLGVDALDLDGDASTVDTIDAGVCVTGTEIIGLTTGGMSCATGSGVGTPRRFRFKVAE